MSGAGYAEDLAFVHDAGFGEFARRAGEALLPVLARRLAPGALVVDLGSGSGIWARRLLDAGYRAALRGRSGDSRF